MRSRINKSTSVQTASRILLGLILIYAGIGHLTFVRKAFSAQVPPWVPMDPDLVVILSGVVEILIGLSLIILFKQRIRIGWIAAAFFVLIFPGNIAQLVEHRNALGMNTDLARWIRLPFQPVLVFVSLWSTGAWQQWRRP